MTATLRSVTLVGGPFDGGEATPFSKAHCLAMETAAERFAIYERPATDDSRTWNFIGYMAKWFFKGATP